jgi:hypothetical protein
MDNVAKGEKAGGGKIVCILTCIALTVLIAAFWWFSLRPTQIKKECYKNNGWSAEYYECLMNQGIDFKLQ